MEKFKKFVKKYISTELPVRLCIFNMMSIIGILGAIVSIATTYIMKIQSGQIKYLFISAAALVFLLYLANVKKKLKLASLLICAIVGFGIFAPMFIMGGGIHSGMPIWFMLVIVFEGILIEGKLKYILCFLTMTFYSLLIYIAYAFPDYLSYFETEEMVFMDVGQSIVFVGICILCIISFQLYMYDLALKRAEEAAKEAEKAKEEAIAANAAKSTFLAGMSHEIRTPMGVIIGMNEMIQRESNQSAIIEYSKDVTASANTLLSIINDILDFSKIESGKMNIIKGEYETEKMIDVILDMAKIKSEETGILFETKFSDRLPSKLVGDELRIKECLINLVSNAFKYTEKGKITFEISCEKSEDKMLVTYSVKDTGRGIRKDEMATLFDSFVRLDESRNKAIQGTGLGLNITSNLLKLMGSKLELESTYQKGSRFYFTLEQEIIDEKPVFDNKKAGNEKPAAVYSPGITAPDAHILVVDDNIVNIKVFCALLKQTQIQIDTASGGPEAIELVRGHKYDMIFMDHMMPVMDGEETLIKLKEENLLGDTPIIMLTANAIVGMREHFLEVGFTDYLSKPIEFKKLEEMIGKYL